MVKQLNEEQISRLKTQAEKYGGVGNEAFKVAVDKQYGTGSYNQITKNVAGSIASGAIQGNKDVANKVLEKPSNSAPMTNEQLAQRNKERDIAFNEVVANPDGLVVTNSPGNINSSANIIAPVAETTTPTPTSTIDAINQNISETQKAEEDRKKQQEARIAEDKKIAEDKTAQVTEQFAKYEQIIKDYDVKIAELQKQSEDIVSGRLERDVQTMENKKQYEVEQLRKEQDLQKWKDEQAAEEAKKEQYIRQQQAVWGMNKLGLGFGSGIINTVQRIATEGATAIAGLKIQASANQATFANNISKIELDYTKEINSTIDKYTDIQLGLKKDAIDRAYKVQNSILTNDKEKQDAINKIKDELVFSTRKTEDEMYKAMEASRDKQLERTMLLEQEIRNQEAREREKLNVSISSGQWNSMSVKEQEEFAKKSGTSVNEVETIKRQTIYSSAVSLMQASLGEDYIPTVAQTDEILSEVNRLLLAGRPLEESIRIVTNRVIKRTPEYKNINTLKNMTMKAKINSLLGGGSRGTSSSNPLPKASDIQLIFNSDGTVTRYDKVRNIATKVTETVNIPAGDVEAGKAYNMDEGMRFILKGEGKSEEEINNEMAKYYKEIGEDVKNANQNLKSGILEYQEGKTVEQPVVTTKGNKATTSIAGPIDWAAEIK